MGTPADTIIRVENLGKKYLIRHHQPAGYTALRDVIVQKARSAGRRLLSPFHANGHMSSPAREDFWALKDISFEVKRGEVLGIIGRNGAGKSTLLKILSRITEPTAGRVTLNGRVASLLEVGTGFHPELTGRENVFLNGAILGMSRRELRRKFDEIVDFAGVEKFLDTPVKHYSSGMGVRLAFAVAAHLDPEILLVDEVLAVGDAAFQKKCLGKISLAAQDGRTVLFVSHNMESVTHLCSQGILLNAGQVECQGDIASVVARYLPDHLFAAEGFGDLAGRGDRSGSGCARFRSIELLTEGKRCVSVAFGKPLTIKLTIDVTTALDSGVVEILIRTADGTPVHELQSQRCSWSRARRQLALSATIPGIRMYPGNYVIDLWLGDWSTARVDYLTNALTFGVIQTPESGIERALDRKYGLVYQHSDWNYEGMNPACTEARF